MRLVLLLAALLAGCAAPAGEGILVHPVVEGASAPSCAGLCSHEWYNATIVGGPWSLALPLPVVRDAWSVPAVLPARTWPGPVRVEGEATVALGPTHLTAFGPGNATIRLHAMRVAPAGGTPDEFLRARWDLAMPRAGELRIEGDGASELRVTFEAVSDLCERRAHLAAGADLVLRGDDRAWCA